MKLTRDLDMELRTQTALVDKDQVFVIVDENTARWCLPKVLETLEIPMREADTTVNVLAPPQQANEDQQITTSQLRGIFVIPAGEEHKTLETVTRVWDWLIDSCATRRSLIINVGGGVVTDLGGFAASTFKRGVPYVNIPTTLLAMVDAGIGGKTGIDYRGLKNEIGLFAPPKETIVCVDFLKTLPSDELLSGFAEMVKHALISSPLELADVLAFDIERLGADDESWNEMEELVRRSYEIKNYIVDVDPTEQGMRQTLNFGHTVGHALEMLEVESQKSEVESRIRHGYAVMYGMVAELYLSVKKDGFPEKELQKVLHLMKTLYGKPQCACKDYDRLIELMKHDKKNAKPGVITCTLLRQVGNYHLGVEISEEEMKEALDFLMNC